VETLLDEICREIVEMGDANKIKRLVDEALTKGIPLSKIIDNGLRRGLEKVGKKYENGEYFLSELLYAASLMNEILPILKSHLKNQKKEREEVIVLGTVRGDIHDVGKNIFKMLAQASGFEIIDLGVDVEPRLFVKKLKETNAKILGLSALLTTTRLEMKTIIDQLNQAGIRNKIKVLIGGNAVTKEFAKEIGADAAALDAVEGVEICKRWVTS
jgi:5-methyltetrahydrofolate--homocysteine methyltransferase